MSEILTIADKVNLLTIYRGEKGDSGNSVVKSTSLVVSSDNQTIFPLLSIPLKPSETYLVINGVCYDFGESYNLNLYTLTWLDDPFQLKVGYRIKFYF